MKTLFSLTLTLFSISAFSQLTWSKLLGGSATDEGRAIHETADGGYMVFGFSSSTNGDVSGGHGGNDVWVAKLDSSRNVVWQKAFGGNTDDVGASMEPTADGGYIIGGHTNSTNGDVAGNKGGYDFWIIKIDAAGAIQWSKTYGGSGNDQCRFVQQTSDGGYIASGYSASIGGDVGGNKGSDDCWVVKLDAAGSIVWEENYGGTASDVANSIKPTNDGGYIFSGRTASNDGDVSGNNGSDDLWLVKINGTGSLQWQKCFGENQSDAGYCVIQSSDGGYMTSGSLERRSGTFTFETFGFSYFVKTNSTGTLEWSRTIANTSSTDNYEEFANSIIETPDGGYLSAGRTYRLNFGTPMNSYINGKVIKLFANGQTWWSLNVGGTGYEGLHYVTRSATGGYLFAGATEANDGHVSGNKGGRDLWIFKINDTLCNHNPVITAAGSLTLCAGQSVTLQATTGAGYSYVWRKNGLTVTGSASTLSVNSAGSYDVIISASISGGSCAEVSAPLTVIVNQNPACAITGDSLICSDDSTVFIASGGVSYQWSGPGGFTGNDSTTSFIKTAGTYSVTVTGANGCTTSCSRPLNVTSIPNCNITGNSIICEYQSTSFTVGGGASYSWSGPNGFTKNTASTGAINVGGVYSVTVTGSGCVSSCSRTLTVNTRPICSITGDTIICANETTSFTASGGTSYSWAGPSAFTASTATISNLSSGGIYSVTVTNSSGCTTSCSQRLNWKSLPPCNITGDNTICSYETTSLEASGGTSFTWSGPNGFSATTATTGSVAEAGVYSVTVTDSNLCSQTCTRSITVNSPPLITISGDNVICTYETADFTAAGAVSYTWSGPSGFNSTTSNTGAVNEAGTYSVTGTDANGCTSDNNVSLTVNSIPIIEITGDTLICDNETSGFTATGGTNYSWLGPNGFSSNSDLTGSITEGGTYTVTVTNVQGCTASDSYNLNIIAHAPPAICIVGVDSATGKNMIVWEKPTTTAIDSYIIYKETNQANVYEVIGNQPYSHFSTFIDNASLPEQNSNTYKLAIKDTCGLETLGVNTHSTVHLSINQGVGNSWNLIWNHYEGFSFGTYNIYRRTPTTAFALVNSVSSSLNSYTDLNPPASNIIYYQIEVENPNSCNPSARMINYSVSRSNIVATNSVGIKDMKIQELKIFPNPFVSTVTVILPADAQGPFELKIFDIAGSEIRKINSTYEKEILLQRNSLATGVYYIEIKGAKEIYRGKLAAF